MKAFIRSIGAGLALGVLTVLFSFTFFAAAETSSTTSSTTVQTEATCTQGGGKWCKNSDGASGWCSQDTSYTCPAYDEASCKVQSGQWCTSSGGGKGWCSTSASGCPISDEAGCAAKGYTWCKTPTSGTSGMSGWCSQSANYKCPAYDESGCKAQGGDWCQSSGGTTATIGWCAQNGATCPVNDQSSCAAKGRSWCNYQSGSGGWCASVNEKCPAYDATTCKTQGGDWCPSSGTAVGWCAQGGSSCPVNDEAICTVKGRSWCKNTSGSGGWCASVGATCGGTTTFSWPQDEKECTYYKGKWCQQSSGSSTTASNAYCIMGTMNCSATMTCWDGSTGATCPSMPSTKADCEAKKLSWCTSSSAASSWCSKTPCVKLECEKKSYYWCEPASTGTATASSGWCSESACMKMPPTGKMTCPDGRSFAATLSECPKAETISDTKQCDDGTIVKKDAKCPEKKSEKICKNGAHVPADKECPVEKISEEQMKKNEEYRKQLLSSLSTLELAFKEQKYDEALTQLVVVRESIQKVSSDSVAAWEDLQAFRAHITALEVLRKEKDLEASKEKEQEALQQRALEKLKRDMISFQTKIIGMSDRIKRDKRKKIIIPAELEENLSSVKQDISKILASTQYDEAREHTSALAEKMDIVNELLDDLTRSEDLFAFGPLFSTMDTEISKRASTLKSFKKLSASSRDMVGDLIAEANTKLQYARDALAIAKKGSFGEYDDPYDYLEQEVVFVLDDIDNDSDTIRARLGLKSFLSKTKVRIAGYKRKISRSTPSSEEIKKLLLMFEEKFNDLSRRAAKKISPKDQSLQKLIGEIVEMQDSIEKELGLLKETPLEKKLRELREKEKAQHIELPELDKIVSYADTIGYFLTSRAPVIVYGGAAWDRSRLVKR
ncbi:hypothetical protein HY732_03720 [Candidatus Uhrbacteria bacterium]|nr:hypothetical protein [Candidatus Uhrbacteria bacterium]